MAKENILTNAVRLAQESHSGQQYGNRPYICHCVDVADVLREFGVTDVEILAAGYLHDTMEDAGITREQIERECSARVAEIVWRVTDEPGENRKKRKRATYPKIAASDDAVAVKLADRIANFRECIKSGSDLLAMYRREWPEFSNSLRKFGSINDPMWEELDGLMME